MDYCNIIKELFYFCDNKNDMGAMKLKGKLASIPITAHSP
jgi:hypothetical protein